nr:cadmium resistance transporter [Nocardioides seonyuensis]
MFLAVGTGALVAYCVVFLGQVVVFVLAAKIVATRKPIAEVLERWEHILFPLVLILIGLVIPIEGGAFGPRDRTAEAAVNDHAGPRHRTRTHRRRLLDERHLRCDRTRRNSDHTTARRRRSERGGYRPCDEHDDSRRPHGTVAGRAWPTSWLS